MTGSGRSVTSRVGRLLSAGPPYEDHTVRVFTGSGSTFPPSSSRCPDRWAADDRSAPTAGRPGRPPRAVSPLRHEAVIPLPRGPMVSSDPNAEEFVEGREKLRSGKSTLLDMDHAAARIVEGRHG